MDDNAVIITLLENTQTPVFILDRELNIISANQAAQRINRAMNKPDGFSSMLSPGVTAAAMEAVGEGRSFHMSWEPTGGKKTVFCMLPLSDGERIAAVCVPSLADGTTVRGGAAGEDGALRLESTVRRSIAEMFAGLSVIRRRFAEEKPSVDPYLAEVTRQAYRLLRNCENITEATTYMGSVCPDRKIMDIWGALSEICLAGRTLLKEAGYELSYSFPEERDMVNCHLPSIERAVMNLISNACRSCGRSGHITVKGVRLPNSVMVSVGDDGKGIEQSEVNEVFLPYYTSDKDNGLGMGLAAVKAAIYSHGGTVTVTSNPGEGAVFSFTLPICDLPPEDALPLRNERPSYMTDRFSEVFIGLCDVVTPPEA